jgi:hypothetical protein
VIGGRRISWRILYQAKQKEVSKRNETYVKRTKAFIGRRWRAELTDICSYMMTMVGDDHILSS